MENSLFRQLMVPQFVCIPASLFSGLLAILWITVFSLLKNCISFIFFIVCFLQPLSLCLGYGSFLFTYAFASFHTHHNFSIFIFEYLRLCPFGVNLLPLMVYLWGLDLCQITVLGFTKKQTNKQKTLKHFIFSCLFKSSYLIILNFGSFCAFWAIFGHLFFSYQVSF